MTTQETNVVIAVIVIVAGSLIIFLLRNYRAGQIARKKREDEDRVRRKTVGRQDTLGGTFFNVLERAVSQNRIANVLPSGDVSKGRSRLKIGRIPSESGYTFLVYMEDKWNIHGQISVLQVTVDLFREVGKGIHILHCPYGPDHYFTEEEADAAMQQYAQALRHYSVFPETQRKHLEMLGISLAVKL